MISRVNNSGFFVKDFLLNNDEVDDICRQLFSAPVTEQNDLRAAGLFSERNLFQTRPAVRALASSPQCLSLAKQVLGNSARAVKATLFDKTPSANWMVPPHQDVTIAVQKRIVTPGFGPWTFKSGVHNVQPPVEVLESMLALRIHLDGCDENNGALKVWPNSHAHGRLGDAGIKNWTERNNAVICPVLKGGGMCMRPLLIHASSKATAPTNRRVIHIEYAGIDLPGGLRWLDELS